MQISPLLEQLIERLQSRESLDLEFKECRDSISDSFWETVSAFANTQGGWILLGVSNKGLPVGVRDAEKMTSDLFNLGRNRQKVSSEVWSESNISAETVEDKNIIVVRVPAAPRTKRPVYINGNPMTGTFLRRHEGDYRCLDEEVKRMFREASQETIDSSIVSEFSLEALSQETINRYRQRLQNRSPEHEFNDYPSDRFLAALGAIDPSAKHPTVAGLLLFGADVWIRRWRKRHLIDYRQNPEKISDTTWIDRLTWEGNLFDFYFRVYQKLTEDVPVPHRIEAGERIEETPTHTALREALVNLLVHADYTETNASLIIKSPEGYYFRNPGASRIPEYELFTGNRSDPRNPTLLFMFRLLGLAEEAGSGLPRIIRAWRSLGFQMPSLEINTEKYEFGLLLRNIHLFSGEDRKWLMGFGEGLTEPEQLALVYARRENRIDNERIRTLMGMHPADATKVLTGLRDRGLLKKESDRRGAYYQIPGTQPASSTPSLFDSVTDQSIGDVDKPLRETRENLREEQELLREIKKRLRQKLNRAGRRQFINSHILKLCFIRPYSSSELGKVFHMTPTNMVNGYLNILIESGDLQWTGVTKNDRSGKYVARHER